MGKKYTAAEVDKAAFDGYTKGYEEAKAEFQQTSGTTEPVEPDHGSYTLTVRYKHTKYAGDDTDFTTALVKELAEDEFRFVTDHFDVLSVEVNADTLWQG